MPRSLIFSTLLMLLMSFAVFSQQDDDDVQNWNDVQLTVPINKRVNFTLTGTFRFGSKLSRLTEGRIAPGFVFKVNKAFSIAPSYTAIMARNSAGGFNDEHRFSLRGTYKFPTKVIEVSHRSIYEYRVRTSGNSWRYRAAITFERKLPEKFIPKSKLFLTEEVFYVSTNKRFSRNRVRVGISKEINKKLTLDFYYLRQNDGQSQPGDLNVIGSAWKIQL